MLDGGAVEPWSRGGGEERGHFWTFLIQPLHIVM